MKGIIFTEFIQFAEARYGIETVDSMIESCDLMTGGAYTSVGNYELGELVQLVVRLSELTNTEITEILRSYGNILFDSLVRLHPEVTGSVNDAFDLLKGIDTHIHVEVRKLYADAEPPAFECEQPSPDKLLLTYRSNRGLADVAQGLIEGCFRHFHESVSLSTEDLSDGAKTAVRFVLQRGPADK